MPGNKWWDGYNDQEVVIMDDFPKDESKANYLGAFLKQWVDRYAFNAEIKGCVKTIRPKTIVITSNWHPREIWSDIGIIEPLLRRFNITKRDKKIDTSLMPAPIEGEWLPEETKEEWVERHSSKKRKAESPLAQAWSPMPWLDDFVSSDAAYSNNFVPPPITKK